MNINFVERASLPQPRLEFAAEGRYLTVRLPEVAHPLDRRPDGARVAVDFSIHRHILYQEPAAGLEELGDALDGTLWFRKQFVAYLSGTLHQKAARRRTCMRSNRTWTTSK